MFDYLQKGSKIYLFRRTKLFHYCYIFVKF